MKKNGLMNDVMNYKVKNDNFEEKLRGQYLKYIL